MAKIDYKKELKQLYGASKTPTIVEVPALNYLMIDGEGRPDHGHEYQEAASTIYPVAYTLKFMIRGNHPDIDYDVMPLETIWRVEHQPTKRFYWTMLMMQPDYVTEEIYTEAVARAKAKAAPPRIDQLRFTRWTEGKCAQVLHIGPYDEMNQTFEKMLRFITETGYSPKCRDSHDVYLNDVRKTKPENLKAIIRLPVELRG